MATAIITLTVSNVETRRVPPRNKKLGNMLVFDDKIKKINDDSGLRGRHSGFCVRVRKPEMWLCEAGYILPGIPGTPFANGGQLQARGLLDFASPVGVVAITGGTGDYSRASGHVKLYGDDYVLTIHSP